MHNPGIFVFLLTLKSHQIMSQNCDFREKWILGDDDGSGLFPF